MGSDLEKLEAVFYSSPIPHDLGTLTFLGLVFDRVHFPNVYIPADGFDREAVVREIERLDGLGMQQDYDVWLTTQLLKYALCPQLREFCYFTGQKEQIFGGDEMGEVKDLVIALEEQIHGPPKPGFHPTYIPGYSKGLDGHESIDYPGPYFYQSNALVYAGKNDIPLLNADPRLPVPALSGQAAKHNTKLLSAIMAMECVNLVLPEVGELQPDEILEARSELLKYLLPFRMGLLRLSSKLNAAIEAVSDQEEIVRAARFVAETDVYPSLLELKNELSKPKKGWGRRSWELTKKVPGLVASYAVLNLQEAIPKTVAALGDWLVSGFSQEKPRSELYYLLHLESRKKVASL